MNKRILAMAMAVAMLVTCVPQTAYATNGDTSQIADASVSDVNNSQVTDDTTISDVTANDGSENKETTENVTNATDDADDVTNNPDTTTDIVNSETEEVTATGNGNVGSNIKVTVRDLSGNTETGEYSTLEEAVAATATLINSNSIYAVVELSGTYQLTQDLVIPEEVKNITFGSKQIGDINYYAATIDLNGHAISQSSTGTSGERGQYMMTMQTVRVVSSSATAGTINAKMFNYSESEGYTYKDAEGNVLYDEDTTERLIIDNVNINAAEEALFQDCPIPESEKYTLKINGNVTVGTSENKNGSLFFGDTGTKYVFGTNTDVNVNGVINLPPFVQFYNITAYQVSKIFWLPNKEGTNLSEEDFKTYYELQKKKNLLAPTMRIAGKAFFNVISVSVENNVLENEPDTKCCINTELVVNENGSIPNFSFDGAYISGAPTSYAPICIKKVDSDGNTLNYVSGEQLATGGNASSNSEVFLDPLACGDSGFFVTKKGNAFIVAKPTAKVTLMETYTVDGQVYASESTRTYSSFDEAIAAIGGSDFINSTGNRVHTGQGPYTIELLDDCSLSNNMTVSSLATALTITTPQGESHALDMQGHTLTSAGVFSLYLRGGATLTNTSATRAALNFTHRSCIFSINATDLPTNTTVINGVDINLSSMAGGMKCEISGVEGNAYKILNSTITAGEVAFMGGDWTADTFNVKSLNVGDRVWSQAPDVDGNMVTTPYVKSTLHANAVTATASVGIFNTTSIGMVTLNGAALIVDDIDNYYETYATKFFDTTDGTGNTPSLNVGTLTVSKKANNYNYAVIVHNGALLAGDTFNLGANSLFSDGKIEFANVTSANGARMEMYQLSETTITTSGTLFGLALAYHSDNGNFIITDMPVLNMKSGTSLAINGTITSPYDDLKLKIRTIDDEGNLTQTAAGRVIFTTNMKSFPTEYVTVDQPDGFNYHELMQIGSSVMVAGNWITVGTIQSDTGREVVLKQFAKWSDAIGYVNEIANATTDYYIEISEDITTMEAFSVPAKAKSITIRGAAGVNPTITCLGNLAPAADVTFKDIKVNFTTYDAATKSYITNDKAVMNFSGRKITLDNAYFLNKFSAANGAKNSTLVLKKGNMPGVEAALTVTGALTTGGLYVDGYTVTASNVTSQTEATLKSATITSAGNITFVNVTSLDANNKLTTGAGKANKLTISGTYSDNAGGNTIVTIKGADGNGTATAVINTNAIGISSKYVENEIAKAEANGEDKSYVDYTGQVLATAAKLPATALVIGRQGATVSFLTKKNGNNLVVDPSTEIAVTLYEVVGNANQVRGNFAALQEALTEIDRYANKNANYEIQLVSEKSTATDANGNGKVTSYNKDLSMPRQLASLTITSADSLEPGIFTKGTLTLNSDLTLKNVKIYPYNNLTVNLGNYSLSVEDADLANGKPIANVNGANTSGNSGLAIKYTNAYTASRVGVDNWTINGNLRTSKLSLNGANVTVHGTTSVGEIKQEGLPSSLRGTAKVATKKVDGELQISDVTPNITIERTIVSEENEFTINLDVVRTENRVNYYDDLLGVLDDYSNFDDFKESTGIKFAKALKADPSEVSFTKVSLTEVGSVVKKGGFFVYTSLETLPYTLTTDTDTVPCFSFADAVTEINNRNDKNADYTITLNASDEYYRANPETYVMPAAAKIHSLTIQAKENHATLYYGTKNAKGVVSAVARITLTTNTTIKNVTFMDAEVVANTENGVAPKRAPFTFALGGKNATFDNVKFEGRALIIDGGRNGELTLTGKNENIIEGNITNVKTLTLDADATLLMKTYVSNARGAEAKPTLSVTNFTGNNNKIRSEGSISLVNVTSTGTDVSKQTVIEADGAFTVSGTVTASLDNNLVLIGRQKNDRNKTSQLNVTGTVAGKKALVALLPYDATAQNANTALAPSDAAGLAVVTSAKNGVEKFSVADAVTFNGGVYTEATAASFDPTAAAASRGTALVKSGNVIYAYDASNIHVGVKIVDESALATRLSDLNNEDMMGYYLTFADAVNAINAKNNRNNCYDIVLLDDINVASVALPAANKAKAVSVQGYNSAKKLTVSKAFAIPVNTTLIATTIEAPSVSQTAKTTLTLNANSVIDGTTGAVSLQNVATDGTAKINYVRNNRGQSQLTIAGDVINTTGKLTLCMAKDYKNANATVSDKDSYMANDKAEINANKLLFTGAKVKASDVVIKVGDEVLTTTVSAGANAVVKNANGFYFVNSSFLTEAVGLGDRDAAPHTYYLDLNQATNQIKVNADKKDYTVYLGVSESGNYLTALDANVTDRNDHSAIVLPANNTVGSLTIKGKDSHTTKLYYSGSITGYIGAEKYLTFESIEFVPVAANDKNGVAQPVTNSNITLNRNTADRTGEVSLVLDEVVVTNGNGDEGYLNAIVGQKNATNVETNNPLTLVTGFTNVNTLTINGANKVVAGGRSSINTLDFEDAEAGFVAIGATTVGNIVANATGNAKQGYGYITGTGRGFTLTGGVIGSNTVIRMGVLKPGAKYTEYDVVDSADNIDLLTAPKADPARFALYGETVGTSTKVAYKFGNTIRVDEKANLKVKVTGDELSAYAHDYPEAIAAINTWGDKTKDYTITFLDTAGDVVTTNAAKNSTVPTNITYPRANAAKSITITSETDAKTLRYTANLSPVVATTFDKVKLDNGTYNGRTGVFTSNHKVNIVATGAALEFTSNAKTVSDDNGTANDESFDVNTINSTKGLILNGQTIKANGTVTVTTLNVNGDVTIRSTNGKAITLTNVVGSAGTDFLTLDDPISGSATALNAPQLKINGTVTGVEKLILDPLKAIYNGRNITGWEYMTLQDLEARRVTTADTAANLKNKVLSAGMQRVPTDIIVVRRYEGVNPYQYVTGTTGEVYKSGTNLYLIASPGYLTVEVATDGYEARFLTWTDAVNDINARKDKNADYTITLLNNVGNIGYNQNGDAVGNVTFPAATAAKSVTVTEPDGEDYTIYFTNTTLSIPTNVTIDGVEMVPVKKQVYSGSYTDYYTKKKVTYRNVYAYENPSGFAINITGNNTLTLEGTPNENNSMPWQYITTISGANLRLADEAFVYTTKNVTVKNLYMEHNTSISMSEKANLTVQNSATMEEQSSVYLNDGNVSMKDPNLKGSVNANNITFTGTASLSQNAYISSAVSKTKGQGRLTIANLVIGENGCNLTYKQDANGNPMLNITGTVIRDSNLTDANKDTANARISVLYNNCSMNKPVYVSLTNGSKMFMAAKVTGENVGYFMPVLDPNGTYGHILTDGYELYKLPKNNYVFYGAKPVNAL